MPYPTYYIEGLLRKADAAGARTYLGITGGGAGSVLISAGTLSSLRTDLTLADANGVSFGLNAAGVVTASIAPGAGAGTGFTSTSIAGAVITGLLGAGGLNLGVPNYLTTAQPPGAYLTTAAATDITTGRAGTAFATTTSAGVVVAGTLNTAGLTLGVPPYITTYVNDLTSGRAGTGFSTTTSAGVVMAGTINTNGLTLGVPPYITTYVNDLTSGRAGVNTSVATTAGTDLTLGVNTSGVTIGYPKWITTYVNDLTSGRAGIGESVSTTAGTDLTLGVDTNGVTIGYPKWITTYVNDLTSGRAGTGTSATNATITLDTNGLAISVANPGGAAGATASYWANLLLLPNTSTVIVSSNWSYLFPIYVPYYVSASYLRLLASFNFTSTTIATSAVNNATGASTAFSFTAGYWAQLMTQQSGTASRILGNYISASGGLTWAVSVSQASTSNASRQSITQAITYPFEGGVGNITTQYSVTATNGAISTTQWSNLSAARYLDIPFATLVSPGNYWVALGQLTGTVGSKSMNVFASSYCASQTNFTWANMNSASNTSNAGPLLGVGQFTTNAAGSTASMGFTNISNIGSTPLPLIQMIRQA